MDISNVNNIALNDVDAYHELFLRQAGITTEEDQDFASVYEAALNMLNETSDLQNQSESMKIQFALGQSDNLHDLLIAQEKSGIALQYTVAVKDRLVEAYREIMQMQI